MTKDFMTTGEQFLLDLDELIMQVRKHLKEQTLHPAWDYRLDAVLSILLDNLFYGSVLYGERELEKKLRQYGMDEIQAIKSSRLFFSILQNSLNLSSPEELGHGLFEYQLFIEHSALLVRRSEMSRRTPYSTTTIEIMANAIEQSIQCGDYVPERLRRVVAERRH